MHIVLAVLMVAAVPTAPPESRYPDAVEVYACGFEPSDDRNFDGWPEGWTRRRGTGFPHYLPIKVSPEPSAVGRACLRIDLDGGAATAYSPPVKAGPDFSYVLEGFIKTEHLERDRAFFSVTFFDAHDKPLETVDSERIQTTDGWTKVRLGPFHATSEEARVAVVGLHLEPVETGPLREADLHGSALFDDVWLGRLPRMTLDTVDPQHLYQVGQEVPLSLQVAGIAAEPHIDLSVEDAFGQPLDDIQAKLKLVSTSLTRPPGADSAVWSARWEGHFEDPGFYRVRIRRPGPTGFVHEVGIPLVVLEPGTAAPHGEFGWTLTKEDLTQRRAEVLRLLGLSGIGWAKLPLWVDAKNEAVAMPVAELIERFENQGVAVVGMLDQPPDSIRQQLHMHGTATALEMFVEHPEQCAASLDPLLVRFGLQIRRWQLGADRDTSLASLQDPERLKAIAAMFTPRAASASLGIACPPQFSVTATAAPWKFVVVQDQGPVVPLKVAAQMMRNQTPGPQQWSALAALDPDSHAGQQRVTDLVERMLAAKLSGAATIGLSEPFTSRHGIFQADGIPNELFLPWRTIATTLAGSELLGSIPLPEGSENYVFARGREVVIVVRRRMPRREVLYFGEDVRQTDIWGRSRKPAQDGPMQIIDVEPMPSFITGANAAIARWRLAVKMDQEQLPTVFGIRQHNAVTLTNTFDVPVRGVARVVAAEGWRVWPDHYELNLAPGESVRTPIDVFVPVNGTTDSKQMRFDFEIDARGHLDFSAYRPLRIGPEDIHLETTSKLLPDGKLKVRQTIVNESDRQYSFRCYLYAPGEVRQRSMVMNLGHGQDEQVYELVNGKSLVGKTCWIRAEQVGGPLVLSYRFVVK